MRAPVRIALLGIIAIVALLGGMLASRALIHRNSSPAVTVATLLTPPRAVEHFELLDARGRPFGPAQLRGQWNLVFFGFTNCPDVCPTTLTLLAQVEKLLASTSAQAQTRVVFVSVDPARDTPAKMAAYTHYFSPTILGVTGTEASIEHFTRNLGVPVMKTPVENGQYSVDHSSAIFLFNPRGELAALFSAPHDAQRIAADLRNIIAADEPS